MVDLAGSVPEHTNDAVTPPGASVYETHSAVVFFFGDRAYKVKKPVDLGFLDFTTVEARRAVCHREVELNRRLAPDVYLGVAEVTDAEGMPCEWMVVMRRMPEERRLSTLVRSGVAVDDELRALARMLAVFHAKAKRGPEIDDAGSVDGLWGRWMANLAEMEPFRGDPLEAEVIDEIADRAMRYLAGRRSLFTARVDAGLICDGHGDLSADDVFCLPDGPRALDCLEFDDRLRWIDGLDDAAFLAMDLERLGKPDLGAEFLDYYGEFTGGRRIASLEHHYVAYRAGVRAKVSSLRYDQGVGAAAEQARALARLALRHLRAGEPRIILVGGLPGTGKSTVAGGVADALNAVLLRSDRIRKENDQRDPRVSAADDWERGLYGPDATRLTYDTLFRRARELVANGESVVLDASWNDADQRAAVRQVAVDASSLLVELRCEAPGPLAAERIQRRACTGDPSDATVDIAAQMAQTFAPWPQAETIDTTSSVEKSIAHAVEAVTTHS
ncbi:MAG: bifunctional aminoglycoside phosphotransferase/ATP-binding protein [Mycobacteriaceae bacterium]